MKNSYFSKQKTKNLEPVEVKQKWIYVIEMLETIGYARLNDSMVGSSLFVHGIVKHPHFYQAVRAC